MTTRASGRRVVAVGIFALSGLVACGRYGGHDGRAASSAAVGDSNVLDDLTGAPGTEASDSAAAVSSVAISHSGATNAIDSTDERSGFALTLVVENGTTFAHDASTRFQLTFRNTSAEVRYIDAAQWRHVAFLSLGDSSLVWDDGSCRVPSGISGDDLPQAVALAPGESSAYVFAYPSGRTRPASDDPTCPVAPGRYAAVGLLAWCPPPAVQPTANGQPVCDESQVVQIQSAPLGITVG